MVAARERSSFVETASRSGRPRPGRHARDVVLDRPVARSHSRGCGNCFRRQIYDRAQLVGCQPIVPLQYGRYAGPIVNFYDELLRQIEKRRMMYAQAGRRLAIFF